MTPAHTHRPVRAAVVALAALSTSVAGCATEPPKRPVEELFREALAASRMNHDPAEDAVRAAALARRARPVAPAAPLPEGFPQDPRGPEGVTLVSDVFAGTDIREAIASLASQAGARVVVDDGVRGAATAIFEKVRFEDALDDLLAPHGYVYRRRGGRYLVGSADPKSAMYALLSDTREYAPRHVSTQELIEVLPKATIPYVSVSPGRNLIRVCATREMGNQILDLLARADQPIPQVVLEAIVCEYAPGTQLQLGFDSSQGVKTGNGKYANVGLTDLAASAFAGPAGAPGLQSFQFYSAFVNALATEGYVSMRAAPRVMVKDGERATIVSGEQTFFTVTSDSKTIIFTPQLQSVQTGITLDLTPRIQGECVSVKVDRAEVSDQIRPSDVVPGDDVRLPTINTRKVSTTVCVRDGETIVLGGLLRHRKVQQIAKIPFLGDIPFLGILFQKRNEIEEDSEIAIFISPRIVRQP